MRKKIIYFVTEDWYFWSHRLPVARAAQSAEYDVVVATAVKEHGERIRDEGFRLVPLDLRRSSASPLQELRTVRQIISLYGEESPDVVHHVGLKPVLYGSIAAWLAKTPLTVNALAGLGHLATAKSTMSQLVRFIFSHALKIAMTRRTAMTIFQNRDDRALCVDTGLVPEKQTLLIKGSGVDVDSYVAGDDNEKESPPLVLMASRMLKTKGVYDFVSAARELKRRGVAVRMVLAGAPDGENLASLTADELKRLNDEGVIEYWGSVDDMPSVLRRTSIAVLPSLYGEGVPKSLLEAAAAEVALIAYDMPGCRDIARDGKTGLVVRPGDVKALGEAIAQLVTDPAECRRMGKEGRRLVMAEFSETLITEATVRVYEGVAEGGNNES